MAHRYDPLLRLMSCVGWSMLVAMVAYLLAEKWTTTDLCAQFSNVVHTRVSHGDCQIREPGGGWTFLSDLHSDDGGAR